MKTDTMVNVHNKDGGYNVKKLVRGPTVISDQSIMDFVAFY